MELVYADQSVTIVGNYEFGNWLWNGLCIKKNLDESDRAWLVGDKHYLVGY